MIGDGPDRMTSRIKTDAADGVDGLAAFDGYRVAVILPVGNERVVVCGRAVYVRDDGIGNVLNICLDTPQPGSPVVVISEGQWDGRIIPDFHYGCDFCLVAE